MGSAPIRNLQLYLPKYFKSLTSVVGIGTQETCAFCTAGSHGIPASGNSVLTLTGILLTEAHLLWRRDKKLKISLNKFF